MITFTEELKVVQLPVEQISEIAAFNLQHWADFKDTNKSLGESLASIGTVEELLERSIDDEASKFYTELIEKMNEAGASYVQIVKI